MTFQMMTNNL